MTRTTVSLARAVAPTPHPRRTVRARARRTVHDAYTAIERALDDASSRPPSERPEALERASDVVRSSLRDAKANGRATLWNSISPTMRRDVFPNELERLVRCDPGRIASPSDSNDVNFIVAVTLSTSALATVVGVVLPGDWGAFGSYLIGSVSLVVLAIGSTAPGLLRVGVDRLARANPEYRRRVARHEAGHFLVGFALGVPVASYDLGIDSSHVNFMESKLERKIFSGAKLTEEEVLPLAVISMAGVAGEALTFDDVMGQNADLYDLQRILNRVSPKLSDAAQQSTTRWAVFQAATILKENAAAWDALTEKMIEGASVTECLVAIEDASSRA
jgi:hypothetical protein